MSSAHPRAGPGSAQTDSHQAGCPMAFSSSPGWGEALRTSPWGPSRPGPTGSPMWSACLSQWGGGEAGPLSSASFALGASLVPTPPRIGRSRRGKTSSCEDVTELGGKRAWPPPRARPCVPGPAARPSGPARSGEVPGVDAHGAACPGDTSPPVLAEHVSGKGSPDTWHLGSWVVPQISRSEYE